MKQKSLINQHKNDNKNSKLKRLLVLHIPNTFNYGSAMMGMVMLDFLKKTNDKIEIWTDYSTKEDQKRLLEVLPLKEIGKIENNPFQLDKKTKLFSMIEWMRKVKNISFNGVFIIGGDDLSEYYSIKRLLRILITIKILQTMRIPVFLVGQTIGPFYKWRKYIAIYVLKKCNLIYTRDDTSKKYLEIIGVKNNLHTGGDLAFLTLPKTESIKETMMKFSLAENDYITIVPSGLHECYTSNLSNYLESWLDIVKKMVDNKNKIYKRIVLLPHVCRPYNSSDMKIIEFIMAKLNKKELENIVVIPEDIMPQTARNILGSGMFTITGRMHAAISTFAMKKPAISLSYSVKYNNIIGVELDLPELIIEATGNALWRKDIIVNQIITKTEWLTKNYKKILEDIGPKVDIVKNKTLIMMNDIKKEMENI